MQDITIYHNPNCGTSRNTLALIGVSTEFGPYRAVGTFV